MKARWATSLDDGAVKCSLCPHRCRVQSNERGLCLARENRDGVLYATQYGKVSALAFDPIEKKPLYHFHPGEHILSVGGYGCNLSCQFCQNWHLSTNIGRATDTTPQQLIEETLERDSFGVCFTYNEPLINLEYVIDTFELALSKGLKTVIVSNGYANRDPIAALAPLLDAANIDIKAGSNSFYKELCGGSLEDVLETVAYLSQRCHVELTYLIIPTANDSEKDIRTIASWVAQNCPPNTALHFSAYYPSHHAKFPATPQQTLVRAWEIAKEYLKFVYLGNIQSGEWSDTRCPKCNTRIISRRGYAVSTDGIAENECNFCHTDLGFIVL